MNGCAPSELADMCITGCVMARVNSLIETVSGGRDGGLLDLENPGIWMVCVRWCVWGGLGRDGEGVKRTGRAIFGCAIEE